jgi:FixJ family two-component response regulator/glycine cleavage system H lipoate-binding protein
MSEQPTILVVDDEEVVCQACQRIFSRQGFRVEISTDARQGLEKAVDKDYHIILLDIKMPNMDGIAFLEHLRQKKPTVPVLIITGYPSIPNAASAMRLGACDYVTKPFTSEEITSAVRRVLAAQRIEEPTEAPAAPQAALAEASPEVRFFDEAWLRVEADGSACVGAVLPGLRKGTAFSVVLPRIGEVVYQGLPLAGVAPAGKPMTIVPAPLTGVVLAVNDELSKDPTPLATDPCGEGWIACLSTTRFDEELPRCKLRRIVLVCLDAASAETQRQKLVSLGCDVQVVDSRESLLAVLQSGEEVVVFLDAESLGEEGPALAALVNARAPNRRVVVVAAPGSGREAAYRKQRIFYYAVEPFADNEIVEIITAAFRPAETPPAKSERRGPSEPISSISITNRNGHKVQLLAAPGLLWRNEGLGHRIAQKLLAEMFPVVIAPGEANLTPANILKTVMGCHRLMVLISRDAGLLPGKLVRDTKPDFGVDAGEAVGKITMLAVQPDAVGSVTGLDERTVAALADHVVREMASY